MNGKKTEPRTCTHTMSLLALLRRRQPTPPIYLRAATPTLTSDRAAFARIAQEIATRPTVPANRTQARRP